MCEYTEKQIIKDIDKHLSVSGHGFYSERILNHYLEKGMRGSGYTYKDNADVVYCYEVTPLTLEVPKDNKVEIAEQV